MLLTIQLSNGSKYKMSIPDERYFMDFQRNISSSMDRKQFIQLQGQYTIPTNNNDIFINPNYISNLELDKSESDKELIKKYKEEEENKLKNFKMDASTPEKTEEEKKLHQETIQPLKPIFDAANKRNKEMNDKELKKLR